MKLYQSPRWIIAQLIWWKPVSATMHIPRCDTLSASRAESVAKLLAKCTQRMPTTWRQFYTKGYRCVRVTLEVQG